jgi:glycosyltransferase involved in cell wall biosynthesis
MTEAGNPLEISERKIGKIKILQKIYQNQIIKPMLKGTRLIFSINEECRQYCEKYLLTNDERLKIKDVNHYIDYKKLKKYYNISEVETGQRLQRIIFWGRVAEVKGIDLIIHAVEHLKIEGCKIQFYIIGDGSERRYLEKLSIQLDLQKVIKFLGRCDIEHIATCSKNSDVFVMASHTEGIPTSMLEAMVFGLPVVTTSVGGIPTLIKNGVNGYLIKKREPSTYAKGIKNALGMDREAVKLYNTTFIEKGYSVESVVKRMDDLMYHVIK